MTGNWGHLVTRLFIYFIDSYKWSFSTKVTWSIASQMVVLEMWQNEHFLSLIFISDQKEISLLSVLFALSGFWGWWFLQKLFSFPSFVINSFAAFICVHQCCRAFYIFVGTRSLATFDLKDFLLPECLVKLEKMIVYFKGHKKGFLSLKKFYPLAINIVMIMVHCFICCNCFLESRCYLCVCVYLYTSEYRVYLIFFSSVIFLCCFHHMLLLSLVPVEFSFLLPLNSMFISSFWFYLLFQSHCWYTDGSHPLDFPEFWS